MTEPLSPDSASVPEVPSDPEGHEPSRDESRKVSQVEHALRLAEVVDLFYTPDGVAYADVEVAGHRETWELRSPSFRRWLSRGFYEKTGGALGSEAIRAVLEVLESKAHFDGPERPVFVRVGERDGRIYLDLANEHWQAVEIDAVGWRVVDRPAVRFRRASGMRSLPVPRRGGSINALRPFLNIATDADFVLVVAWALACLRPRGPYPLLALSGEQGSAKSTFSGLLRALLDPNKAPLRTPPHDERDLFIAATNGHVLAFDNLSGLRPCTSDAFCRLATGGGFAVRALYTDQEETLLEACRPIILNGIEDVVTRPDLADRALVLHLEPIPEEQRRSEAELWARFEAERPTILGALLDAVSTGLRRLSETRLPRSPRMADFALWATACETALWPEGTFEAAYAQNRSEAVEEVLEADPVAAALRALMADRTEWVGTATDLLADLEKKAGGRTSKVEGWPGSPRALAGRLKRVATFLRTVGITISKEKGAGRSRERLIRITTAPSIASLDKDGMLLPLKKGLPPSAPSAPSAGETNTQT